MEPEHQLLPPQAFPNDPAAFYPDPSSDITGGLPISLDSLRDGPPGSKPFYPYSTLIRYAIKGSPTGKLLLEDIYYAIESRFPYFRTAPSGWKNSVRHNLSLNPCFEKVSRPLTDRGKGSYWTVNDQVDPRTGVHRVRKKKTPATGKGKSSPSDDLDTDYTPPDGQYDNAESYIEHDDNRQQHAYPPPYPQYGPTPFPMMPQINPYESFEIDEHGNINWRASWRKELNDLLHVTEQQEKSGADEDWYRLMLWRLKAAFMPPPPPMQPGDQVVVGGPPQMVQQQRQ